MCKKPIRTVNPARRRPRQAQPSPPRRAVVSDGGSPGASSVRTAARPPIQDLSPRTLLTRLEQQSGQLGILRSKLDETRKEAAREREAAQAAQAALEEERAGRGQLEATLKRERVARKQAEETLEESRATASALEAQHHLLRAQLKALEHKGRGRLFRRKR